MKILIIGGSRFVGPVLVNQLLEKNHDVTVFNRGVIATSYPTAVKFVQGDRSKGFDITEHFDTVIDMCAYNGLDTQAALNELSFDHFVHFGTVATYKKSEVFPFTEESEQGYVPVAGEYSRGKLECEKVLANSSVKHAVIRPDYIIGPNNYLDRENFIYQRIHVGKEIVLPGNGQAMCQFVFVDEVAAIIRMITERQLTGAYNCAGDEFITLKGVVELMGEIVGKKPKISYNPAADGEHHNRDEFPFANDNLITSNQKLKDLGFKFIPLATGLRRDYQKHYKALLSNI